MICGKGILAALKHFIPEFDCEILPDEDVIKATDKQSEQS